MNETPLQSLFDAADARPLTVSELNADIRDVIERRFASVWVEGEVVNFVRAASGHWYFNLNDGDAQIKCVCWKGTNFKIRFRPENGITVRIRGRLSFYEARGETQVVVESLEPSGEGALRAAFEQIRARLDGEGLFDAALKRPIPFFPRKVGVVTSRTGAAFHDILNVLTRRARSVSIVLAPALVQGEGSADSIRNAVVSINEYNRGLPATERIDVLIVGRGGGSAEDLWAFNDEHLARAIRSSEIPVISAIGHEIDWTIADLISDLRAATPSAAAEIVAAREEDIFLTFRVGEQRLFEILDRQISDVSARFDLTVTTIQSRFAVILQRAKDNYHQLSARFTPSTLRARAAEYGNRVTLLDQLRVSAMGRLLKQRSEGLNVKMAKLDALSPLAVLTRGYSITQTANGEVLRDPRQVQPGDRLQIRLDKGKLDAEVLPAE